MCKLHSTCVFLSFSLPSYFFPRICSVPEYPLFCLSLVVKLLKRNITFVTCLMKYSYKEGFMALIIGSLNRISFLPQCDRPFTPDCGKNFCLKLENCGCFISCYAALYVHNRMKVLCGGCTYCIIRQKHESSL